MCALWTQCISVACDLQPKKKSKPSRVETAGLNASVPDTIVPASSAGKTCFAACVNVRSVLTDGDVHDPKDVSACAIDSYISCVNCSIPLHT